MLAREEGFAELPKISSIFDEMEYVPVFGQSFDYFRNLCSSKVFEAMPCVNYHLNWIAVPNIMTKSCR